MSFYMYVALQGDNQIVRFLVDPLTGNFEDKGAIDVPGGPAPLAINPSRTALFVGQRAGKQLSSYSISPSTGELNLTGVVDVGEEACYLSTDKSGKFLLSAYYQAGHCAVHPIDNNNSLGGGAIEWIATNSGAHCFQTDPSNRFAYLPHIADGSGGLAQLPPDRQSAINSIFQYRFDGVSGKLTPNEPASLNPESKDGPRHYCFHPYKDIVYFSNEQGCSVTMYAIGENGTLSPIQTVPTLPEGFSGKTSCSQIQIHPEGKFLYVPNRGHNSIASFKLDTMTGKMTGTGWVEADPVPRAFSIDTKGQFLYVCGLDTGTLATYKVDQESGTLAKMASYSVGNVPMWVSIIEL
ncbi:MAG: 6-phosphogluconolactonase [Chloroflexota bacterium]|nr:MAG: 6-phosphogluconolactonase [Chloroflexota bacterium]